MSATDVKSTAAAEFVDFFAAGWAIGAADRERFYAHFRERFHPQARLLQPIVPPIGGPDPLPEAFGPVFDLVPDLAAEVVRWGETADGVMIELAMRGTLGGRRLEWTLVDRIVLEGGMVRERQAYFDPTPLLARLEELQTKESR
jgi:hypothetical protein